MSRPPTVTVSILWNWGSFFLGMAVMFIMTPVMMNELGQTQFGIWNLIISFVSYFELLEFGIRTSLVRIIAERHSMNDMRGLNAACSSSLVFFCIVGFCIILSGQTSAYFAPSLFKLDAENVGITRNVMQIYSLAQGLQFPLNAYTACLIGLQRYDVTNRFQMAATLVRISLTYLALKQGCGLMTVALIHSSVTLLCFLGMAVWSRLLTPGFAPSPFKADRESFRGLSRLGGGILAINIALRLVEASGPTLAGMMLSMKDVAYLSVAVAFARYLGGFVEAGIRVMIPYLGALTGVAGPENQQAQVIHTARISLVLTMIVSGIYSCGICIFGRAFLLLWLGQDTSQGVAPLLPAVMALALAGSICSCCLNLFLGLGVLGRLPLVHWIETGASIGLSYIFISRAGLVGLPLAALGGVICVRLPCYLLILRKRMGPGFIRDILLRTAALVILFAAGWASYLHLLAGMSQNSYLGIIAGATAYAASMAALTAIVIPGIGGWARDRLVTIFQ